MGKWALRKESVCKEEECPTIAESSEKNTWVGTPPHKDGARSLERFDGRTLDGHCLVETFGFHCPHADDLNSTTPTSFRGVLWKYRPEPNLGVVMKHLWVAGQNR